jgi:hypothetical protein
MKAKDYFEKYKEPLRQATDKEARGKIVAREEALMAIIEEMNGKLNAPVRLVEKEFGAGVLVRDTFRKIWAEQLKELPENLD